jgi:hypothetical protein
MLAIVIIVIAVAYLAFHLGAGHTHHRYRKAHGLSPNFYWSSVRGPYASVRLPEGSGSGTGSRPVQAKHQAPLTAPGTRKAPRWPHGRRGAFTLVRAASA